MGKFLALAILAVIQSARAANTNYWTNSVSGSFYDGANYAAGIAPVNNNADVVFFTNNASYSVTNSGFIGAAMFFNAPGGVITNVQTGTVSMGYSPQYLGVGDSFGSTATVVQVGAGQMSAGNTYIGNAGVASYTVLGPSAILNVPVTIYVGYTNGSSGSSLLLTNGARFTGNQVYIGTYESDNNSVILSGAGTTWTNTGGAFGMRVGFTNSSSNLLRVENGARMIDRRQLDIGLLAGSSNNVVMVTGTNSYLEVGATSGYLQIGQGDNNNSLIVSNGGSVRVLQPVYIGGTSVGITTNNNAIVTGAGSVLSNTTTLMVGYNGGGNTLRVENGGQVISGGAVDLGFSTAASSNNLVLVTGTNSYMEVGSGYLQIGRIAHNNTVIVSNGAAMRVVGPVYVGGTAAAVTNNTLIVSGPSSVFSNTASNMYIGYAGGGNTLRIENGGEMASVAGTAAARLEVGHTANSSNNTILVTGSNSVWGISASGASPEFSLGFASKGNTMVISNGGKVRFDGTFFEVGNATANNAVLVSGSGSVFSNVNANFYVGYNSGANLNNRLVIDDGGQFYGSNIIMGAFATSTGSRVQVLSGGLLEANVLSNQFNASNTITNFGGIFQFTTATPGITRNGSNIVITNGTVSFRNVAAADVKGNWSGTQLTNMLFQGDNTFRLNNSSNSTTGQDYTFNTGLGATNYVRLEMISGNTAWRSSQLTIGGNGTFLASNTVGTVAAVVTNLGNIEVMFSKMTWSSNMVVSGKYVSDPSTNTYLGDVTVDQSGTLAGGAGDLFDFKKSLFINATNQIGFQLANSAVMFSGGGMHTNAITGVDLGSDKALAQYEAFTLQTNFAYGELHLGSAADQVCFTCGNIPTIASNGLYVGWLDLLNDPNLVTNLHAASGINIYYNLDDTRNSYLNGASYQLTDCNFAPGGGYLMGIPEPSALLLISAAAGLLLHRKRKH